MREKINPLKQNEHLETTDEKEKKIVEKKR